jgi:hypothetical protein
VQLRRRSIKNACQFFFLSIEKEKWGKEKKLSWFLLPGLRPALRPALRLWPLVTVE